MRPVLSPSSFPRLSLTDLLPARSEAADFFAFPLPSNKPFSFAFDYTFFCALPPLWREKWGNRYAEVVRPGGLLVCLAFPIGACTSLLLSSSRQIELTIVCGVVHRRR